MGRCHYKPPEVVGRGNVSNTPLYGRPKVEKDDKGCSVGIYVDEHKACPERKGVLYLPLACGVCRFFMEKDRDTVES